MTYIWDTHEQYKINAANITAMRDRFDELHKLRVAAENTYSNLYTATRYMNDLIKVIRENPGLQENWVEFLATAGIDEPKWKHEYTVDIV